MLSREPTSSTGNGKTLFSQIWLPSNLPPSISLEAADPKKLQASASQPISFPFWEFEHCAADFFPRKRSAREGRLQLSVTDSGSGSMAQIPRLSEGRLRLMVNDTR